jgi:hypothetical protein
MAIANRCGHQGTRKQQQNKKNGAEVGSSFLKRKQRAGSSVGGKKQRQKVYLAVEVFFSFDRAGYTFS